MTQTFNNPNSATGLTPVKAGQGGTMRNSNSADYTIASAYSSAIYRGDPCAPTGTGNNISLVAAGSNAMMGSFHGVNYVQSNGDTQFRPFWAASTALATGTIAEASVFDDPDLLFDIQVSGTAGLVNTNIGNTANWLAGSPQGSALTGQSAGQLDQSTLSNSSTTQQFQVQSLRALVNNAYGQYARALVSIYLHYKKAAAPGTVY